MQAWSFQVLGCHLGTLLGFFLCGLSFIDSHPEALWRGWDINLTTTIQHVQVTWVKMEYVMQVSVPLHFRANDEGGCTGSN